MVEGNRGAAEGVVALAIVDHHPMGEKLGNAIRAARIERRRFQLRDCLDLAEHLGGRSLEQLGSARILPEHLEDVERAHGVGLGRIDGLLERGPDEALCGKIVKLVRHHLQDFATDVRIFDQVEIVQRDLVENVEFTKPAKIIDSYASDPAMDGIAFVQQQSREIGAILTRDSGDECSLRHFSSIKSWRCHG